jgi:uncharacterized RDD family membrane protein YckC
MGADNSSLRYGGFWVRAAALVLDELINLPLIAFVLWAGPRYRLFQPYFFIPWTAIGVFYNVYLVRRFGGTPGKLLMRLRVRKKTGEPVGYHEAILREAPNVLLGALATIAMLPALSKISDAEFHTLPPRARSERLAQLAPAWSQPLRIAGAVWNYSELVVLLTNRKRRALHDFIAGTVVIYDETSKQAMARTAAAPRPSSRWLSHST